MPDRKMAGGQTERGHTDWKPYDPKKPRGIYVEVDTSDANFKSVPAYVMSLAGDSHNWELIVSIYNKKKDSFRAYARFPDWATITPQMANERGRHINWIGVEVK